MLRHFGIEPGLRMARKHVAWYSRGLPGSAGFRAEIMRLTDAATVRARIDAFYAPLEAAGACRQVERPEPEAVAA
jgi:tRNA-dihydrouridine synthase B